MAKENKTIFVILGLLNHEAMSGYDIKKRIDVSLKYFWDAGFGQIYPALKQMETTGMVSRSHAESPLGPDRIVYAITEVGRQELKRWLAQPPEREHIRYEILLKLFFGSAGNKEDSIEAIKGFGESSQGILMTLEHYKSQLEQVLNQDPDHMYYYLTVLFGERMYKAYAEWSEEAILLLQQQEHQKDIISEEVL